MCAGNEIHAIWDVAQILLAGSSVFDAFAVLTRLRMQKLEEEQVKRELELVLPEAESEPAYAGMFGAPGVRPEENKELVRGKDFHDEALGEERTIVVVVVAVVRRCLGIVVSDWRRPRKFHYHNVATDMCV